MSFSNRLYIAALGGCVALALLASLPRKSYAQGDTAAPILQTQEQQPAALQAPEAKHYKVSCDKPEDHQAADLCEQRRMSSAAEGALWWARLQTWLGGFGFFVVIATLIVNGRATKAASRAAATAGSQLELSRQALISTERAFIFVSNIHAMAGYSASKQKVVDWTLFLTWENLGNTPTRNMRMGTNWHSFDGELPDDFDFPEVNRRLYEVPIALGPKATTLSGGCEIPIEILEDVRMGKKHVYVWGWVEYDDIFEGTKRHRTESCIHLIVVGDPKVHQHGPNNEPMVPFEYRGHKFFNGADEECYRQPVS